MGFLFLYRAHPTLNSVIAGTLFIAIGECIRLVGAGTLRKYKGVVSQNGIYAYTRNPLYIGSFLLGIGACIIGRDPLFALLFPLLFIPVYYHVIKREEAFLFKQYGSEYECSRAR